MYQQGLLVASQGNLSVRLDAQHILVTAAGCCKGALTSKDLIVTDLSGRVVGGTGLPSSEIQMHLLLLPLETGFAGGLPCASAYGHRICCCRARA